MKATSVSLVLLTAAATAALLVQPSAAQQGKGKAKAQPADLSQVEFATAQSIADALAKGGPATTPRASMVSRDSHHLVAGGRRDAGGDAERHENAYDVVYIVEGSATYVTGGKMVGAKETGPGEMLGGTLEGGEVHQLNKGDVIVVPPGIPHWWKDTDGVTYMIIKVNK